MSMLALLLCQSYSNIGIHTLTVYWQQNKVYLLLKSLPVDLAISSTTKEGLGLVAKRKKKDKALQVDVPPS